MAGFRLLALVFMFGLLFFQAGAALASTASAGGQLIIYTAASGEANAVVFAVDGTNIRISDPGATISAGSGCVPAGADVLCDTGPFGAEAVEFFVELRDGNDSADFSEPPDFQHPWFVFVHASGGAGNDRIGGISFENFLFGGSGNDRLTGGGAASVLNGGGGNDQLLGRTGEDQAFGGPGNDSISGGRFPDWLEGGPGDDSISGGRGRDLLEGGLGDDILSGGFGPDLVEARSDVNFRLTPTALIGAGSDTLSGIERARLAGGPGNNVIDARSWRRPTILAGGGGNDFILGGFGRDRITGGRGNDRIAGRAKTDLLSGGPGADVLFSRDQRRDQVSGGGGWDRARVDSLDVTRLIEVFFS